MALRIFNAKNEAHEQPAINLQIARAYLMGSDPLVAKRTWQHVLDEIIKIKTGPTQVRCKSAAKDKAFTALAEALDADADVVEMVVGMDMEMLLATGYLPASTNRASSPLDDTSIAALLNNGTTQALLQLTPVRNAKTYQVQTSVDGGKTWVEACISTQARRIVLTGLVPGTTYAVRARAIGGSTGASGWTSPSSIMST